MTQERRAALINDLRAAATTPAPRAIWLLLKAYAVGELNEETDWSDVDLAHESAFEDFPELWAQARAQARAEAGVDDEDEDEDEDDDGDGQDDEEDEEGGDE